MKPIFDNLRKLVGGKRKRKETDSGFKRSDSFRRISIRKSYLDRGKKKNLPKLEVPTHTVPEDEISKITDYTCRVDFAIQVDRHIVPPNKYMELPRRKGAHAHNKNLYVKNQNLSDILLMDSFDEKGSEKIVIYVPGSDNAPSPPTIRKLPSSPWGDTVNVKKSPAMREKQEKHLVPSSMPSDSGNEDLCSLSKSLGRIWIDVPQLMSPRSPEIPSNQTNVNPSAHRSLDSGLRDLKDGSHVSNRLQKKQVFSISRTSSSNSNNTTSTGVLSSRDSGLSLSVNTASVSNLPKVSYGFFRKEKANPPISVSRGNYFERNNLVGSKRSSLKTKSKRKTNKSSRGKKQKSNKCDIYQVILARRPCQLNFPKSDPMIFVRPERRNPSVRRKKSFKSKMCEIRNFNLVENIFVSVDSNNDEYFYGSLPDDLDMVLWRDDQINTKCMSRLGLCGKNYDFQEKHLQQSSDDESSVSDNDSSINNNYSLRSLPVTKYLSARRRKSTAIFRKRTATFVVRPTVFRAPSSTSKKTHTKAEHSQSTQLRK